MNGPCLLHELEEFVKSQNALSCCQEQCAKDGTNFCPKAQSGLVCMPVHTGISTGVLWHKSQHLLKPKPSLLKRANAFHLLRNSALWPLCLTLLDSTF